MCPSSWVGCAAWLVSEARHRSRFFLLLFREMNEDLFERRFAACILTNGEFLLVVFHETEHLTNGRPLAFLFARKAEFERIPVCFEHLHFRPCLCQLGLESVLRRSTGHIHVELVTIAVHILQMRRRTQTAQTTTHHDADATAQCFTLLHGMSRQDHTAMLHRRGNQIPHETTTARIHAGLNTT